MLSCGVSPRAELAALSGLRTAFGVLVDRRLRSWSDPDIYAIGDCAHIVEHLPEDASARVPGGPSGLIGPGLAAGRLAGRADAGRARRLDRRRLPRGWMPSARRS